MQTAQSRMLHYRLLADEALRAASATVDRNARAEFLDAAGRWSKLARDAERTGSRLAADDLSREVAQLVGKPGLKSDSRRMDTAPLAGIPRRKDKH